MTVPGSYILVQAIMSAIDDLPSARLATANTFGASRTRRAEGMNVSPRTLGGATYKSRMGLSIDSD